MGVMFKKQADFVRKHLDAIEDLLDSDNALVFVGLEGNNAVRDNQNGQISLIIDNETYDINREELDTFIVVENTLHNLTEKELRLVTSSCIEKYGLTLGGPLQGVEAKVDMTEAPCLVVKTRGHRLSVYRFFCDGTVIKEA